MSKIYECSECSSTFAYHQHLRRHYKKKHPKLTPPSLKQCNVPFTFPCEDCGKEFNYYGNLTRHIKTFHASDDEDDDTTTKSKDFKCEDCNAAFSKLSSLGRHKRLKHFELDNTTKKINIIHCSLCSTYVTDKKSDLFRHFEKKHNCNIISEILGFETENDFLSWKIEIESKTMARFVCGRSQIATLSGRTSFYNCHRSGFFNSNSRGLRKPRKGGSCKINSICPARMKVVELESGNYVVEFTKTHIGHGMNLNNSIVTKDVDYDDIEVEILPEIFDNDDVIVVNVS